MGSSKHNELPSGWEIKKLDEVSFIDMGQSPDSEFYNEEEIGLPLIQGNADMKNGRSIKRYFTSQITKKCNKGDFILSVRAPVGKIGIASFESCLGRGVCSIRSKSEDSNFLFQLLLSLENKWEKLEQGSTFSAISGSDIKNFKILLPPLPEQRAIANILSTWDTAIQTTQALITQKEAEKKWLMQNLLTGKKRLKGFSEEWKEVKMSYIFERVNRKNSEQNTNVVTISAQRGFVRQTDFFNKTVASDLLDNYFLVEKGEFCYNKSYSNGYPWGATKRLNDFDKAVVTTLYICFKIADSIKNSGEFFEQFFNANSLDRGLTKIAHEGGRAHGLLNVTPSDFFELKITTPDIEEQTAIAQVLQTADKELNLLKTKLEQQKLQKKGLMQVLLTGKVRVAYV